MYESRFNFQACRECTDYWGAQGGGSAPPCVRVQVLGPQGLMAVEKDRIGGNGLPCCPAIISWTELQTYATGGAGAVRMSTEAQGLIRVLRARMNRDTSRRWVQQPEWVGYLEKGTFKNNYYGYLVATDANEFTAVQASPRLAGEWRFVRRLADAEMTQLLRFRATNGLDVDWNDFFKKLEGACAMAIPKLEAVGRNDILAYFNWQSLSIMVASIAVMFGPQGVVLGIARGILAIVGFGTLALQILEMFKDFGFAVARAQRPQELDAAANKFVDLVKLIAVSGLLALLFAGVNKWMKARNEAAEQANRGGGPPAAGRVNRELVRQCVAQPTSQYSGQAFADFPRFNYRPVGEVRAWLQGNGFRLVAEAAGPNSEIWIRTRPNLLRNSNIEAVRIDPTGHTPGARALARPPEGPIRMTRAADGTVDSVRMPEWGNTPHMHKELVPYDAIMPYMETPTENLKYADWNTRTPPPPHNWQAEHIQLQP